MPYAVLQATCRLGMALPMLLLLELPCAAFPVCCTMLPQPRMTCCTALRICVWPLAIGLRAAVKLLEAAALPPPSAHQ